MFRYSKTRESLPEQYETTLDRFGSLDFYKKNEATSEMHNEIWKKQSCRQAQDIFKRSDCGAKNNHHRQKGGK